MWTALHRLGMAALLIAPLAVLPTVSAQPTKVPPYDRSARPGDPPPVPDDDTPRRTIPDGDSQQAPGLQPEVQARGPVHEAFAQPSTAPRPGIAVPRQPPESIQEMPPDQKPEG